MVRVSDSWSVWRVARTCTSAFVLMVAAYYVLVAFDNITDPVNPNASNWPFVQGVLSGDGVPADSGFEWRFIQATWIQVLAYVGVIVTETATGVLLVIAGVQGLRHARKPGSWASAQRWTYLGGTLGLMLFFVGFIVIGGNWFIMYLNSKWNGLEPAFQNSVMTALMLLLVTGVLVGGHLAKERDEDSAGGR